MAGRTCVRCERSLETKHRLCKVCRKALTNAGGNDDDSNGPGVAEPETTESPPTPSLRHRGESSEPVIA